MIDSIPTTEDYAARARDTSDAFIRTLLALSLSNEDRNVIITAGVKMTHAAEWHGWDRGYTAGVENGRKFEKSGW